MSESNRAIARRIADAFGVAKPSVHAYWDDNHENYLAVASCPGSPQPDLTSYSTIGVSDHPLYREDEIYPVRVELVGACERGCESFGNALATAGACIVNSRWFCAPGVIFPDVLAMYDLSHTMKHCLFVPPFLWEDQLTTMELPEKTVTWLLMVPISEAEYRFAEQNGPDALEAALELKRIDFFNIERPSIF